MSIPDRNLQDYILFHRLGHPKIIRATSLALAMFEENSVQTNHCIVKLMHRIAFDCKMYAMMFHVSLFTTFKKILELKDLPQYKVKIRKILNLGYFALMSHNKVETGPKILKFLHMIDVPL